MRYFRWIVPSLLLGLAIYLFTLTLNSPGVEQLDDSIPLIQAYPEEAAQKKVHLPGYKKIDKNAEPLREKVESNAFRFSGRLIDAVSKEPVSKYLLRLYVLDLKIQSDPVVVFEGSIEDEAGRFETSIENFGYYRIEASAEGYATKQLSTIALLSEKSLDGFEMELTPVTRISGRVLDDETGEGIPGAVVGLKKSFIRNDLKAVELVGDNRTDHEGRFSFEDLTVSTLEYNVFALHPDYKEGFVKTRPVEDPIEIRLNRAGFRIHGHARDDSGKPIEGLIISFHSEFHPEERNVLTDSKGNYTSPPLPEGTIRASAGSAYGYTFPCFTPECKWIELRDRDVEVNFGPSGQLAVWQGYLIGWDGQPLKHVYINMDSQTFFKDYPFKRSSHSASSDDKGFFEIPKIPLGKFIVKLHIYSSVSFYYLSDSHDGLTDTVEFPNPVIHIQDFCLPHTEISGCVIDGRTNEPLRSAEVIARKCDVKGNGLYITYTDVNGYYSFHGLPPGKYMMDAGIRVGRRAFFIYELWSNFKLELEEDKFLSNQDIILPASSKVTVTVIGLAKGMKYNVEFFYENEQEACWDSWIYGHSEAFCKDRYDIFHNMAPGHWIMKIWSPDEKVLAEKRFVVHQDQEMDIELDLN